MDSMRLIFVVAVISVASVVLSSEVNAAAEFSVSILQSVGSKTSELPPVRAGEPIRYALTARNSGNSGAPVSIHILFPSQILPSGGSGSGFSCSLAGRTNLSCNSTSHLLAGSSQIINITAKAPETITGDSQTFTVQARIDPSNAVAETNESNNEDRVSITVVPFGPDLTVDLAGSDTTATGAAEVKYVVTAKNIGDRSTASFPFVEVQFPSEISFVRVENSQFGGCNHGFGKVRCPMENALDARASESGTFVGRVHADVRHNTVLTFAARTGFSREYLTDNNSATVNTTVREICDLRVSPQTFTSNRCSTVSIPYLLPDIRYDVLRGKVKNEGRTNSASTKVLVTTGAGGKMLDCGDHKQCATCSSVVSSVCTPKSGNTAICDIGPLAPGGTQDFSLTVVRDGNNSYSVEYQVDPNYDLTESDESNNKATQSIN